MLDLIKRRDSQRRTRRLLPLVLVLMLLTLVFNANYIPSESMLPALQPGDHILTLRSWVAYPFGRMPKRGDIILFRLTPEQIEEMKEYSDAEDDDDGGDPPSSGALSRLLEMRKNILIKRVIGLPGENVRLTRRGVTINGKLLKEPYNTVSGWLTTDCPYALWKPFHVPAGKVFVMGDNRDNSEDSRYWGAVDRGAVVGRYLETLYHENINYGPGVRGHGRS